MDPTIGEIRVVGFNFTPVGWASCNGQMLSISQYTALFSLIGTTYGGDGQTTFAVPNLNSRLAVGAQSGVAGPGLSSYPLGAMLGTENATLTSAQMPAHVHTVEVPLQAATSGPTSASPAGRFPATSPSSKSYAAAATAGAALDAQALTATVGATGGGALHSNVQPVLAMNFIIAVDGIYPSRQ